MMVVAPVGVGAETRQPDEVAGGKHYLGPLPAQQAAFVTAATDQARGGREAPRSRSASSEPSVPQSQKPLTWSARIFLVGIVLMLVTVDFLLRTVGAIVATAVAVIPVFIGAFIIVRLSDHTLPKSFLVEQMFWGAVPGYMLAAILQVFALAVLLASFFNSELREALKLVETVNPEAPNAHVMIEAMLKKQLEALSLWKLLVFAVVAAFVIVAIHQGVTVVIGHRARELISGGVRDVELSAYSMAGAVAGGALGFAGFHQFVTTFNAVMLFFSRPVDISAASSSILSAVLELFVQVATGLLIGCAMARKFVVGQTMRVYRWYLLSVLLHGILYALFFVMGMLVVKNLLPTWVLFAVPIAQVFVFVVLGFVVRSSYKALRISNYELVDPDETA